MVLSDIFEQGSGQQMAVDMYNWRPQASCRQAIGPCRVMTTSYLKSHLRIILLRGCPIVPLVVHLHAAISTAQISSAAFRWHGINATWIHRFSLEMQAEYPNLRIKGRTLQ